MRHLRQNHSSGRTFCADAVSASPGGRDDTVDPREADCVTCLGVALVHFETMAQRTGARMRELAGQPPGLNVTYDNMDLAKR